jgi:hypothetical protein
MSVLGELMTLYVVLAMYFQSRIVDYVNAAWVESEMPAEEKKADDANEGTSTDAKATS